VQTESAPTEPKGQRPEERATQVEAAAEADPWPSEKSLCDWVEREFAVSSFVELEEPDEQWEHSQCINHSLCAWEVDLEQGDAVARIWTLHAPDFPTQMLSGHTFDVLPFDPGVSAQKRPPPSVAVPGGWLVAQNNGEFGGGIWWYSLTGDERRKLAEAHPLGFFRFGNVWLVPQGMDHMMTEKGSVLRLRQDSKNRWRVSELAPLAAEPCAAHKDSDETLLIVTARSLERVHTSGTREVLHRPDWHWRAASPTSFVQLEDGRILVGMRRIIAELTPQADGYTERLLVPPPCLQFELVHLLTVVDCLCVGPRP